MLVYDEYDYAPDLERIIWDLVSMEYNGYFYGIRRLSKRDLLALQNAINDRLYNQRFIEVSCD